MEHKLPELEYGYDSLEPFIDEQTMKIHHTKHHQAYTDKLNIALKENPDLQSKKIKELLQDLNQIPEGIKQAVINNGGGYFNHNFFFSILKKDTELKGEIKEAIEKEFNSIEEFKEKFIEAATTIFGSGWAWLVMNKNKKLEIIKTQNQDSPISNNQIPLITLDVWEHAYYIKYQNKRPEYIESFFNIINWGKVNKLYLNSN